MSEFIKLSDELIINLNQIVSIKCKHDTDENNFNYAYRCTIYTTNPKIKYKFDEDSEEYNMIYKHIFPKPFEFKIVKSLS
jgi:hypothetical protein